VNSLWHMPVIRAVFACLLNFPTYFFPCLFMFLLIQFFENRPVPFRGRMSYKATKPGFSFLCLILCCMFCRVCMFDLVVLDSVFIRNGLVCICMFFYASLDHFGFMFSSLVLFGLVFPVPSQEIGREERLRSDLFCVEWDVKPCSVQFSCSLSLSHITSHHCAICYAIFLCLSVCRS